MFDIFNCRFGSTNTLSRREIKAALKSHAFYPHLQAKVDASGNICGCEALARLHKADSTLLPETFIGSAIKANVIDQLDLEIAIQSLDTLNHWYKNKILPDNFIMGFNLDRHTLSNSTMINSIISKINQMDTPHELIEIEITEVSLEEHRLKDIVFSNILKLKNQVGINIALDDFTLGHSSIESLISLPIDSVKFDKVFTFLPPEKTIPVLKLLCDINEQFGYKSIIEGIETKEQFQNFSELNIDLYQGFYFHKPLPKYQFEKLLIANNQRLSTALS